MGLLLLLLACGTHVPPTPKRVFVSQALDVPPPPGQESLDLGPVDMLCVPGHSLEVEGITTAIVDCRSGKITVYAEERAAKRWLERGEVKVDAPRPIPADK